MSTIEERVAALESALASMTAAEKRIVELPAASSVANDDFVALDGVANGSRRFAASNLGGKAEPMSVEEWDALPDSKLSDCKVYALSGVSPSTQDNPLWQKLGFAALDTTADDCSDAINELNTGLTTLNSNLTTLNSKLNGLRLFSSERKQYTLSSNGTVNIGADYPSSTNVVLGVVATASGYSNGLYVEIIFVNANYWIKVYDSGTSSSVGAITVTCYISGFRATNN